MVNSKVSVIALLLILNLCLETNVTAQVSNDVKKQFFTYLVTKGAIRANDLKESFNKSEPYIKEKKFFPDSTCNGDEGLYKVYLTISHTNSYYCLIKGDKVTFLRNDHLNDLIEDISKYIGLSGCKGNDRDVDILYRKIISGYQMGRYSFEEN